MIMRQPAIIDPKGVFCASPTPELVARHQRYGWFVRDCSGGGINTLLVLSKSNAPLGSVVGASDGLEILSIGNSSNIRKLGQNCARVLADLQNPITWIAGTPFFDGLACLAANQSRPGRIQIQAHGDFGRLTYRTFNHRNLARRAVAGRVLRRADSIRCVSPHQKRLLTQTFEIEPNRCISVPVPINPIFHEFLPPLIRGNEKRQLGFFGRLHRERGLDLWSRIAGDLSRLDPELEFVVIGDGPHFEHFRRQLWTSVGSHRVRFWGRLDGVELVEAVSSLSAILNTCKTEAFGRAMLEAACVGVPTVTVSSPGAHYLSERFSSGGPQISAEGDLVVTVLSELESTSPMDFGSIRSQLKHEENSQIESLVRSWL